MEGMNFKLFDRAREVVMLRVEKYGKEEAEKMVRLAGECTPNQMTEELRRCKELALMPDFNGNDVNRVADFMMLYNVWIRMSQQLLPPQMVGPQINELDVSKLPKEVQDKIAAKAMEVMDTLAAHGNLPECGDPNCPLCGGRNRKKDTNKKGNNTVPDTEIEKLEDFFAREVIELVKKECSNTMVDPNDPKEVAAIAKAMLNGRNLKKNVFARIRVNLGLEG